MDQHQHVKQQISKAFKHLNSAFYWTVEKRAALATYLRSHGWKVKECPMEADVDIVQDVQAGDVVLSRDSDFLVYHRVDTAWRPISKGKLLERM